MLLKTPELHPVLFPGDEEYSGEEDYERIIREETGNPEFHYTAAKGARNRQYWLMGKFIVSHHEVTKGVGTFGQELMAQKKIVAPKL